MIERVGLNYVRMVCLGESGFEVMEVFGVGCFGEWFFGLFFYYVFESSYCLSDLDWCEVLYE